MRSDAEAVAYIEKMANDLAKDLIAAMERGEARDPEEFLSGRGFPGQARSVAAPDIREIGQFRMQGRDRSVQIWVYRDRKAPEITYAIGWQKRLSLQNTGYAMMTVHELTDPD